MTLHFNFWLMLCSRENFLFNNIGHNMFVDILQLDCLTWVRKYRLETPFNGDNVNSSIKTSNFETFCLYFLKKIHKISPFVLFFLILVSRQWLKKVWASLYNQKYPSYALASKSNVTLSQALRLKILQSFTRKSLSGNRRFYLYTRKENVRSDVD